MGSMCTHSRSECARNGEAGAVSHKGSQGRKEEYPTKTLDEKDVPGFGPGVKMQAAPRATPGEGSILLSLLVLLSLPVLPASPLPTAPTPLSPGRVPRGSGPLGCGTGCRGEVSAWV